MINYWDKLREEYKKTDSSLDVAERWKLAYKVMQELESNEAVSSISK